MASARARRRRYVISESKTRKGTGFRAFPNARRRIVATLHALSIQSVVLREKGQRAVTCHRCFLALSKRSSGPEVAREGGEAIGKWRRKVKRHSDVV